MRIRKGILLVSVIAIGILSLLFQFKLGWVQPIERVTIPSPTLTPIRTLTPTPTQIPILTPSPTRKLLPTNTPRPAKSNAPVNLDELFVKYGAIYNVNPDVLRKIAGCESGFDPNQITNDYAGLFQFASFAWREARGRIGLPDDLNLRFNAEESIRTAAFEINYKGTSGWSDCD